jgi:UDP-GlcNAc3NAcA epimerase
MLDTAVYYKQYAQKPQFDIHRKFVLATIHRAENTDDSGRLKSIFGSFKKISRELPLVVPIHPRTRKMIQLLNLEVSCSGLTFVEPVGYLEMLYLLERASLVITDSGGLQKEAYFFKKPCITVREETEWIELVQLGFNTLVGTSPAKIYKSFNSMLDIEVNHKSNLYGNGKASQKILDIILNTHKNEGEIPT